ncbi:MAG TPA: hypothetical protein VML50_01380 [Anaeromyxobacter sp.]|nr:hypothetical protein [Anaeromyxobacter sp.]
MRRSHSRSHWERIAARVLGARFHTCERCGARGWHWRRRSSSTSHREPERPGRPVEKRDLRASKQVARRSLAALLLACLLGAVSGYLVWSCDLQRTESPSTPPDGR